MISEIIDGISAQIFELFGDKYEIYGDEKISQCFDAPCFFISLKQCSKHNMIGGRFALRCSFNVKYFPQNPNSHDEMFKIATGLFCALEFIQTKSEGKLHGTSMQYETRDGTLHFYVNYNLFGYQNTEKDIMQTNSVKINTVSDN